MSNKQYRRIRIGLTIVFVLLCAGLQAQTADTELERVVSLGGGSSGGNGYTLSGVAGQAEVDDRHAGGNGWVLRGGFRAIAIPEPEFLFTDGFEPIALRRDRERAADHRKPVRD